jgi:hypothetical protein
MYILERILRSDAIIIFSDEIVDLKSQIHCCRLRTSLDKIWKMEIPVVEKGLPADDTLIDNDIPWRPRIVSDVKRGYNGLKYSSVVEDLVKRCFNDLPDSKLVNALIGSFIELLKLMGWSDKQIIIGSTLQRRRYANDSQFLLNLCAEAEVQKLYGGYRQFQQLDRKIFHDNDIEIVHQQWTDAYKLNARDSALDMLARYASSQISELF